MEFTIHNLSDYLVWIAFQPKEVGTQRSNKGCVAPHVSKQCGWSWRFHAWNNVARGKSPNFSAVPSGSVTVMNGDFQWGYKVNSPYDDTPLFLWMPFVFILHANTPIHYSSSTDAILLLAFFFYRCWHFLSFWWPSLHLAFLGIWTCRESRSGVLEWITIPYAEDITLLQQMAWVSVNVFAYWTLRTVLRLLKMIHTNKYVTIYKLW